MRTAPESLRDRKVQRVSIAVSFPPRDLVSFLAHILTGPNLRMAGQCTIAMLQHGLAHEMPEAKTWYCSDDKASSTYENSDGFAMTISEGHSTIVAI